VVCFDEKLISPFFMGEPVVSSDTFLVMIENTTLCHVPVGTIFQLTGAESHSPVVFMTFWAGSFLIVG
jgi:hypothetical protein